jgi:hypothetical protein
MQKPRRKSGAAMKRMEKLLLDSKSLVKVELIVSKNKK